MMLQDRLKDIKEIIFIDSFPTINGLTSQRSVFHKIDFHWNDQAAFEVDRTNECGKLKGKVNLAWVHKLEIEKKSFSVSEASSTPIFFPTQESGLFAKQIWIRPAFNYAEKIPLFDSIYEIKKPTGNQLLPIVVLGDIFFAMIRSDTLKHLNKIYQVNWNRTDVIDVIEHLPPDTRYLLLEFIEVESRAYLALTEGLSRR